ncbi:hypothetical protein BH20ACI3_BH20ACI3_24270 [soil metagenome]
MWEGCGWIAQQHSFIVGLLPRVPTYLGWIAIPVVCDASKFGHALRNEDLSSPAATKYPDSV